MIWVSKWLFEAGCVLSLESYEHLGFEYLIKWDVEGEGILGALKDRKYVSYLLNRNQSDN